MESELRVFDRKKLIRNLLLLVTLGLVCLQSFRWENYAFEVTWLGLKSSVVGLEFEDHLRFGSICNSIGAYRCSEEQFSKALLLQPKHLASMGNLAIARSHLNDKELAERSFERYFSEGGLAYDVMYFYAQSLLEMGEKEKGLNWMYRSLSVHTSNQKVANELLDQLSLFEKYYEALSLAGALSESDPTTQEFWRLKFDSLVHFLDQQEKLEVSSIRIPSLDGKSYFVPVRPDENSSWSLFVVDRTEPEVMLNEELLSKWSYSSYEKLKDDHKDSKKQQKIVLDQLIVGPWELQNIEVLVCQSCQPRLGRSILNYLSIEKGQDQIMNHIILKASKEEEE